MWFPGKARCVANAIVFYDNGILCAPVLKRKNKYFPGKSRFFAERGGCVRNGRITDGAALSASIAESLRFLKKSRPFLVGLPSEECGFSVKRLPVADRVAAKRYLKWNFADFFILPVEEVFFDVEKTCLPPGNGETEESGQPFHVGFCRKKSVLPIYDALGGAANIIASEPVILSRLRCYTYGTEVAEEALTILCVRGEVSLILSYKGKTVYYRNYFPEKDGSGAFFEVVDGVIRYAVGSLGFRKLYLHVGGDENFLKKFYATEEFCDLIRLPHPDPLCIDRCREEDDLSDLLGLTMRLYNE